MDIGALLLDAVSVLVGLFVVRLVVLSVYDGWVLTKGRKPEPQPVDPIEDLVQYKARMRKEEKKAWLRDWIAILPEHERAEVNEVYRNMGTRNPFDIEAWLFGDRPQVVPGAAERDAMIADALVPPKTDYGTMGAMKRSAVIAGAVMRTGSGAEISAQGFVPPKPPSGRSGVSRGGFRAELERQVKELQARKEKHGSSRNKPVKPTQEDLKRMMLEDLAVLEDEHRRRLDAELRIEKYGASGISNEEFVRLMAMERSWF